MFVLFCFIEFLYNFRSTKNRIYKQNVEMDSEGGQTNEAFEDFVDTDNEMDKTHDIFCQMDVLRSYNDDVIWKEIRRLIFYI